MYIGPWCSYKVQKMPISISQPLSSVFCSWASPLHLLNSIFRIQAFTLPAQVQHQRAPIFPNVWITVIYSVVPSQDWVTELCAHHLTSGRAFAFTKNEMGSDWRFLRSREAWSDFSFTRITQSAASEGETWKSSLEALAAIRWAMMVALTG